MALGLRGFTKGFVAADEMLRQNERLALDKKRAEREERVSGLQEQAAKLQLRGAEREDQYQQDRQNTLTDYMSSLGVRSSALPTMDDEGNPLPTPEPRTFNYNDMAARMLAVDFKYGKVNIDTLTKMADRGEELEKRGVLKAMREFKLHQDPSKFMDAIKKSGYPIPESAMPMLADDPNLPGLGKQIMAEIVGPDGNSRLVNVEQMVGMSYLSPEKLAEIQAQAGMQAQRERGADRRLDRELDTRKDISSAEMANRLEGIAMQELGANRRAAITAASKEGGRENTGMPTEKQSVQFLMDYQRDNEKAILSDAFKGSNREMWLEKNRAIGERAAVLLAQSGYKLIPQVAWQQASKDINTDARFKGLK